MTEITRVGVDLAKNNIQVHAVDAAGKVVSNRPLSRDKFMAWCAQLPAGCLIAMEASSSAHHWARKLVAIHNRVLFITLHKSRTVGGNCPGATSVSLLLSIHKVERLLSQTVADRCGHDAEGHEWLQNWVGLDHRTADRREHPLSFRFVGYPPATTDRRDPTQA